MEGVHHDHRNQQSLHDPGWEGIGSCRGHPGGPAFREDGFCFFGAEISAGTKLSAHYHREGPEIYYILAGRGRMSLGNLEGATGVNWKEVFEVTAGDCFTVKPGQVHQLESHGETPLNALYGCSATHVTTDRTVLGVCR